MVTRRSSAKSKPAKSPSRPAKTAPKVDAVDLLQRLATRLLPRFERDELLTETLRTLAEVFAADHVSLFLYDERSNDLALRFSTGLDVPAGISPRMRVGKEGVCGWVAQYRTPIVIPEVARDPRYVPILDGIRSEMAAPIVFDARLLGVINVESTRPGFFTAEHLRLLSIVAAQMSLAMRGGELAERDEQRTNDFGMINQFARICGVGLPIQKLLQRIADGLRKNYGYFYVAYFRGRPEREQLTVEAMSCDREVDIKVGDSQAFGRGLIGTAFRIGETVHVPDVHKDERYVNRIPTVQSELCVPVRVSDFVLGILDVQSEQTHAFTQDDILIIDTVAHLVAHAIQLARVTNPQQAIENQPGT